MRRGHPGYPYYSHGLPPYAYQWNGLPMAPAARTTGELGAITEEQKQKLIASASSPWRMLAIGALAYHGYKRNGSVGWAIGWALIGGLSPIIGGAVAIAQGFGKPKAR